MLQQVADSEAKQSAGWDEVVDEVVLVVEDEGAVRNTMARTMRECGYTVLEAAHGLQALEILERHGVFSHPHHRRRGHASDQRAGAGRAGAGAARQFPASYP